MWIKSKVNLRAAFEGREVKEAPSPAAVPERIRKDAPEPALRPGGSLSAQADEVDRRIRERKEAEVAKKKWLKQTSAKEGERLRARFRRSVG